MLIPLRGHLMGEVKAFAWDRRANHASPPSIDLGLAVRRGARQRLQVPNFIAAADPMQRTRPSV